MFKVFSKASYPAKFEEVMNELKGVRTAAYNHLMDRTPTLLSRAFFTTDKVCDAVENGIIEGLNSLILDSRSKPIISILEDIRSCIMLRRIHCKKKNANWYDEVCPSIRMKFETIKERTTSI